MILALKRDFNNIRKLPTNSWPQRLREIPQPAKRLYIRGEMPDLETKWLCIVGSRKFSEYGERACKELISGLAGYPIVIVSGLAYGIDSIAHQSALDAGLTTVAFPGSGLDDSIIYPRNHLKLAHNILESGGCLISEYEQFQHAMTWTFPQRNRLMVGISHAVLIVEASQKSGTMITARLATEYNRDVMTLPGSIFSNGSEGPNKLLSLGATPITCSKDILEYFGFDVLDESVTGKVLESLSNVEQEIFSLLQSGVSKDDLPNHTDIQVREISQALTVLEMEGLI